MWWTPVWVALGIVALIVIVDQVIAGVMGCAVLMGVDKNNRKSDEEFIQAVRKLVALRDGDVRKDITK